MTVDEAIDQLDDAIERLAVDDDRRGYLQLHGLLAVLSSWPGVTVVCRCSAAFTSVREWAEHREDD